MKTQTFTVPLLLTAWVGGAFAVFGIPRYEVLNASNARAIGGDMIRVSMPDGAEVQHLANNNGHANPADIQDFINQGHVSCTVIGRAADGKTKVGCTGLDEKPLGGTPKL